MFCTTNRLYVKNFLVFLLPFLLLSLAACGESGSSGGSSDVGKTAAIEMDPEAETLAAGSGSVYIDVQLTDSTGNPVDADTSVIFRTNIGSFDNGKKEIRKKTADESGMIRIAFHAPLDVPDEDEDAIVEAESNGVHQSVKITVLDPSKVLTIDLTLGSSSIVADGATQVTARAVVTNANGAAVSGKQVNFSSTAGTLITASDITDASGTAEVRLQSSTKSGPVTVRAECDGFTDEASMEFVPGQVDKILLNALPSVVPPDGQFQIAAIAMDENENLINTEKLNFELRRRGSSEIIDQAELTPDQAEDGVYRTNLRASYGTGFFTVTVVATNGVKETVVVQVEEGAVIVGSVDVTAGYTSLEANGTDSTTIRATVLDNEGQPAPDITVNFSTTLGTLLPSSATTKENGIAEIRLFAGYTEGTAKVRAEANGWIDEVEVDFEAGFPGRLNISVIPDSVVPGETATVTARLTDNSGAPIAGEDLYFSLSTNVSGGSVSPGTVTTDGSGQATATYTAGSIEGTDRIRVVSSSNSSVNATASVRVRESGGLEPGGIEIIILNSILPADGTSTTEVIATVRTDTNQAVSGATVNFSTTRGTITSPHVTDENGRAFATLTSARYEDPVVEVTAESQGNTASATMAFTGITLELEPDDQTLLANEETRVEGTLTDANGNPIVNETVDIQIEDGDNGSVSMTSGGGFGDSIAINTDSNGEIEFWVTSDMSGITTVQATARGAEAELDITFSQFNLVLTVDPTTIRTGGETATITATVYENGVPLPGETVDFSSTLGSLGASSVVTNASGEAEVILTSGAQSGRATIEAQVSDAGGTGTFLSATVYLTITGGDVAKIVLRPDPGVIRVNTGESLIRVSAFDANDQPAGGQQIYFRIAEGPGGGEYLGNSVRTTDSNGQTTVRFYAGALTSNEVIIEADTESDFSSPALASATIIISGPVANISVSTNLEELEESDTTEGHLDLGVSAIVTDVNGNPVADGTNVYFGVRSIAFDEDRNDNEVIDCWDVDGNPLTPCPVDPFDPDYPEAEVGITWYTEDVNRDGGMYNQSDWDAEPPIIYPMAATEDDNNNEILDTGEDINGNGMLDPIQGVSIVSPVPTVNGIAVTTMSYPMSYAQNIKVRITAESGGVSNFYDQILLCTETMEENGTCGREY